MKHRIITQHSCNNSGIRYHHAMPDHTAAPLPTPPALPAEGLALLAQHGLRRTGATCTVLALFWHDPHWHPSHTEVEAALAPLGMALNRVTLYRLLDRLAAAGLLERHTDTDSRTWRFALAAHHTNDPDAPRFECDACHRQFRVSAASHSTRSATDALLHALASLGHHGARVDLAVHGTCAGCVSPETEPTPSDGPVRSSGHA